MHRFLPEGGAPAPPSVVLGVALGLCVVASLLFAGAGAAARVLGPGTRCYGAADRVATSRCDNPALDAQVFPTPAKAVFVPDADCDRTETSGALTVCHFGAPESTATRTVALLGDSHASHWRAALGRAGQLGGWHVVGMTRSSCPFTRARPDLGDDDRVDCRNLNGQVVEWLSAHPEVETVFVSALATAKVLGAKAEGQLDTLVLGYQDAWDTLPPTVTRVLVLRDVPTRPSRTTACIEAAIAARRPSMPGCAVRRTLRLIPDPGAIAARRRSTRRVRVVDLSDFMCDETRCYPVVGGVLVNRDSNHLSREFSSTLGPYLLRRARRLLPRPPAP